MKHRHRRWCDFNTTTLQDAKNWSGGKEEEGARYVPVSVGYNPAPLLQMWDLSGSVTVNWTMWTGQIRAVNLHPPTSNAVQQDDAFCLHWFNFHLLQNCQLKLGVMFISRLVYVWSCGCTDTNSSQWKSKWNSKRLYWFKHLRSPRNPLLP